MRLTERLMYVFGIAFAIAYGFESFIWCIVFIVILSVVLIAGMIYEGFRFFQWIFLIVFIPQCFLVFMGEYNLIAEIILCLVILCGILSSILFGEATFDRLKLTGPFQVGHKDIHISSTGNAISVFYPMDKHVYAEIMANEPHRNSMWARYGYNTRLGGARATAPWGSDKHSHPFVWKFIENTRMLTVEDGPLAKVFWTDNEAERKPLIPMLYSHGLTSCRTFQSGSCKDFASHGYIVFAIDHHDGTCNYSRLKNGDDKYWTSLINPEDWDNWISRLEIRLTESTGMIDDLYDQQNLVQNTLGFSPNVRLDLNKLIVGGHSFGGMSAAYTAFREPRVKMLFGFDAWIWAALSKVHAGKFIIKQPQY